MKKAMLFLFNYIALMLTELFYINGIILRYIMLMESYSYYLT